MEICCHFEASDAAPLRRRQKQGASIEQRACNICSHPYMHTKHPDRHHTVSHIVSFQLLSTFFCFFFWMNLCRSGCSVWFKSCPSFFCDIYISMLASRYWNTTLTGLHRTGESFTRSTDFVHISIAHPIPPPRSTAVLWCEKIYIHNANVFPKPLTVLRMFLRTNDGSYPCAP